VQPSCQLAGEALVTGDRESARIARPEGCPATRFGRFV